MDPVLNASLDQMLATIPSQQSLDMKVSDNHLAKIAKALINWKSVCANLGISEVEEEAIKEENSKTDARRCVCPRLYSFNSLGPVIIISLQADYADRQDCPCLLHGQSCRSAYYETLLGGKEKSHVHTLISCSCCVTHQNIW